MPVCSGPCTGHDGRGARRAERSGPAGVPVSGAGDGWSFTKEWCSDFPRAFELPRGNVRPRQRVFAGGTPSLL